MKGLNIIDLQPAFLAIVTLLNNLSFLPMASGLVVILTAAAKKVLPAVITAPMIAIFWQVVIWVIYIIAKQVGYESQFSTWLAAITTIAGALFGVVGSTAVASTLYVQAAARNWPGIGYSRTPSPQVMAKKSFIAEQQAAPPKAA